MWCGPFIKIPWTQFKLLSFHSNSIWGASHRIEHKHWRQLAKTSVGQINFLPAQYNKNISNGRMLHGQTRPNLTVVSTRAPTNYNQGKYSLSVLSILFMRYHSSNIWQDEWDRLNTECLSQHCREAKTSILKNATNLYGDSKMQNESVNTVASDLNLLRAELSKSLRLPLNSCRRIPFLMSMFS